MATIINADTSDGLKLTSDTSGQLELQSAGSTKVTMDATGNVGIGTASPSSKLHVSGSSLFLGSGGAPILWGDTTTLGVLSFDGAGNPLVRSGTSLPLVFQTNNNNERMRIDASGNVLVGTTSLLADNAAVNAKVFRGTEGYILGSHRSITGASPHYYFFNPNGFCGKIETNGSSTSYVTSSDYRLKDNVVPITGALEKVTQLNPVIWKWKVDGSNGQGFIAHELAEVVPDCVSGEKDAVETYTDEDGVEQTRPKYQGIDTSFLVATLTAAIQEQQAIINDLKSRIETLEVK